ncbi:MAG: type II toxin-antitoxin system VapC family toxin [Propionibacteriaceae bacterium]|jgi:predicted nucleic acid-binding protein|nr:type II toxin-antitoxin system VapC family toxin [Propionibacteriaceae bacterium]
MTYVLDASILSDYVIGGDVGRKARPYLTSASLDLHIPHLCVIETVSALRGLAIGGKISDDRARLALTNLADFPAKRWPQDLLLPRIWELRGAVTSYDATYVALAEVLEATLLTHDARLVKGASAMARCEILLL